MNNFKRRYSLSLGASVFLHGATLSAVALALQFEFSEPVEEGQIIELLRVEPVEGKVGLTPMTGPSSPDAEKDEEKQSKSAQRQRVLRQRVQRQSVLVEEKLHAEPVVDPSPQDQIENIEKKRRERQLESSPEQQRREIARKIQRSKPKSHPVEESTGAEPLHMGQLAKLEETVPTPEQREETAQIPEIVQSDTLAHTRQEESIQEREHEKELRPSALKKPNYPTRFNGWEVVQRYPDQVKSSLLNVKNYATQGVEVEISERKRAIFHRYFVAIHDRHIHPVFAHGFLASLDKRSLRDPLNDSKLHLYLEFEIMPDGSLGDVRVLRRSGNWEFDAAALNAIYSAAPFPPPPKAIRSWNGRTYAKWGFFRNRRKCGVFNVDPYLLEKPKMVMRGVSP